jgi:tripartite-type tricarboxylate transporter receptor subunit TctC
MNIKHRCLFLLTLASVATSFNARADDYPNKLINIEVGYSAGGSGDVIARLVAQVLSTALNESVVVQNRPGAAGIIASEFTAMAAPDGYTLMSGSSTELAANKGLYKKLPYDPVTSFTPIIQYSIQPNVLLVRPHTAALPVKNVLDLINYAKAHPGQVSFGSAGPGSSQDMSFELFMMLTGTKLLQVPYRGGANAITDLMGGQINMNFSPLPEGLPYIRSGSLIPLAISGHNRSPVIPNVPTMNEAGVKGYDFVGWHALVAPAGTPKPIIDKLNAIIQTALKGALGPKLQDIGLTVTGGTPEQAAARQKATVVKYVDLIKAAGIPQI